METKLKCEECTKTQNHCCIMDIPYTLVDAMYAIKCGDDVGIKDTVIREHPNTNGLFVICKKDTSGDITKKECVFFVDSKCAIYENRPNICRIYGTEFLKCRNDYVDEIPFKRMDNITLQKFDSIATSNSSIGKYVRRVMK